MGVARATAQSDRRNGGGVDALGDCGRRRSLVRQPWVGESLAQERDDESALTQLKVQLICLPLAVGNRLLHPATNLLPHQPLFIIYATLFHHRMW